MKTVKAVNNKISIENLKIPNIGNDEILVKMRACGICGSDLEKVYGNYGMRSSKVGHEPTGEVMKVGKNVSNFKKGDRVFIHHHVPCYSCLYCYNDDFTMCDKYQTSNIDPCGLSELIRVPGWNIDKGGLVKLPENISYKQAALIEPVACCLRSLNKLKFKKADSALIFGAGPTGLMHMKLLKLFGASNILLVDINKFRLNFAKKINKEIKVLNAMELSFDQIQRKVNLVSGNRGADVSIICTSNIDAFVQSLSLIRKGGTISLFGVPPKDSKPNVDLNLIYSKEIKIIPSYAASEKEIHQTIQLMNFNIINFEDLITHEFDLNKSSEAFESAHLGKDSMKIIITSEMCN